MTPSLTITDRTSGKAYNVPEELAKIGRELLNLEDGIPCSQTMVQRNIASQLDEYYATGCGRALMLDSKRFTISFPNSLSKEVVREVLDKHYPNRPNYINIYIETQREVVESIASDFDITLEETTNGN